MRHYICSDRYPKCEKIGQRVHLLSREIRGVNRKPIIPHVSPKRYRRCREPKPLPLGEMSPKVTERASLARKSRCAAMGRLFVRAILSLCKSCLAAALPSQSRRKLLASSPRGRAIGRPGNFRLDAESPTGRKRAGLAYGDSGFWTTHLVKLPLA